MGFSVAFLPQMTWSMPLSVQQIKSRTLKIYALCPDAVETAENIALHWLARENLALVRAALEELVRGGTLTKEVHNQSAYYGIRNRQLGLGLRMTAETPRQEKAASAA
jgi:hypothetical protein